jgi:hypothetical protein
MGTDSMGVREFRIDSEHDPDGTRLQAELAAQFARDRACLRRECLEHLTVLLAIVLWLSSLGIMPAWIEPWTVLLFAPVLTGLILSCIAEWRS